MYMHRGIFTDYGHGTSTGHRIMSERYYTQPFIHTRIYIHIGRCKRCLRIFLPCVKRFRYFLSLYPIRRSVYDITAITCRLLGLKCPYNKYTKRLVIKTNTNYFFFPLLNIHTYIIVKLDNFLDTKTN